MTTIDVDTSSERVLADMLARYGESPFIVRTPSGGYHALYQNSGEDRRIKPWDGIPVDVLGGGLVVAAPSLVPGGGGYEIIQGSFEDLARLPRVRGLDDLKLAEDSSRKIPHGKRNTTLLRYLLRQAHHCPDLDSLIDMAMTYRDQSCELDPKDPFTEAEVVKTANSAWRYHIKGLNKCRPYGRSFVTPRPAPELAAVYQDPEALFLYYYLRDHFGGKETFQVPNAMAEALGMGRRKFAAARSRLEQYQAIWMVRLPCDRHGAALYRWRDRTAGASTCRLLYPSNTHSVEAGQF